MSKPIELVYGLLGGNTPDNQEPLQSEANVPCDFNKVATRLTTYEILKNYVPNINGGYLIFINLGPWINYPASENSSDSINGALDNMLTRFIEISPTLAYSIDVSNRSVGSDSYNLRHISHDIYGYETKPTSVTVTYLENDQNIISTVHHSWLNMMNKMIKGVIPIFDSDLANDTDIFYSIPYYGEIFAYSFNPITGMPKQLIKYIGIYPDATGFTEDFGSRDKSEHYMKSISYKVSDAFYATFNNSTNDLENSFEEFKKHPLVNEFYSKLINYKCID